MALGSVFFEMPATLGRVGKEQNGQVGKAAKALA